MLRYVLIFFLYCFSSLTYAKTFIQSQALSNILDNNLGNIVILDLQSNIYYCSDIKGAKHSYIPASTFDFANVLIALESNTLKNIDEVFLNVENKYVFNYNYGPNINLKSAFINDQRYAFIYLSSIIKPTTYRKFLNKMKYGNRQIGRNNPSFWLQGPLKVSNVDQVDFIANILTNKFKFKKEHINNLIKISKSHVSIDTNDNSSIHLKLSTSPIDENYANANMLGFILKNDEKYAIAINIIVKNNTIFLNNKDIRYRYAWAAIEKIIHLKEQHFKLIAHKNFYKIP